MFSDKSNPRKLHGRRSGVLVGICISLSTLLLVSFSNCVSSRTAAPGGSNTSSNQVVSIGNPYQSSNLLLDLMCSLIKSCHPSAELAACHSGILEASGFAGGLGLNESSFPTYNGIVLAEFNRAIVSNPSQLQSCEGALTLTTCTSNAMLSAFVGNAPNPYANASQLVQQNSSCNSSYSVATSSTTSTTGGTGGGPTSSSTTSTTLASLVCGASIDPASDNDPACVRRPEWDHLDNLGNMVYVWWCCY